METRREYKKIKPVCTEEIVSNSRIIPRKPYTLLVNGRYVRTFQTFHQACQYALHFHPWEDFKVDWR